LNQRPHRSFAAIGYWEERNFRVGEDLPNASRDAVCHLGRVQAPFEALGRNNNFHDPL